MSASADVTDVTDVICIVQQMLKIIPTEETQLINDLTTFKDALWNQAPEVRSTHYWIPLTSILNNNVQGLDQPWKIDIAKIFNIGKTGVERLSNN